MTPEQAEALRKPFEPHQIGKLPKPTRSDNQKGNCPECGKYHGLPAVHLDYVGHAAASDRFLSVDPEWTWEPMACDEHGLPLLDRDGNLWIILTIAGVTRPGVGDGQNAKERIGDALRNAGMRFGVALDLWSKEDLNAPEPPPTPDEQARELGYDDASVRALRMDVVLGALNELPEAAREPLREFSRTHGGFKNLSSANLSALLDMIEDAQATTEESE